jgi:hypothetical protein
MLAKLNTFALVGIEVVPVSGRSTPASLLP